MKNIEFSISEQQYGLDPLYRCKTYQQGNWHVIEDLVECHHLLTIVRLMVNKYRNKATYKVNGVILHNPSKTPIALTKQLKALLSINVGTEQ
jgi:hypothetical protein